MCLPMKYLVIDGIRIPADSFELGGVSHDVDDATVTITFCNVRTLETVYSHMEEGDRGQDGESSGGLPS